jgi:hypothetical protein
VRLKHVRALLIVSSKANILNWRTPCITQVFVLPQLCHILSFTYVHNVSTLSTRLKYFAEILIYLSSPFGLASLKKEQRVYLNLKLSAKSFLALLIQIFYNRLEGRGSIAVESNAWLVSNNRTLQNAYIVEWNNSSIDSRFCFPTGNTIF